MIEATMIWNEPNNKSHWDPEVDPGWSRFAGMAIAAGQAIKAENGSLPRVLGGLSPIDPGFLRNLEEKGALDHLDVVALHGFPLDWNLWQIHEWPAKVDEIRAVTDKPIWISEVAPGHRHDLTVARDADVIATLNWAAAQLDLPTLADSGYTGAGQGIKTPIKQPAGGQSLAPDNQAYNTLLRSTRCLGERGFALLTGRWRALQRVTISPRRIGELAKAALVLTRIENVQLRHSC